MTTPARPRPIHGHRSELQWIVNDVDASTFRDLFDQLGSLMAQSLPGNEIESITFQGNTLTVKLVTRP